MNDSSIKENKPKQARMHDKYDYLAWAISGFLLLVVIFSWLNILFDWVEILPF